MILPSSYGLLYLLIKSMNDGLVRLKSAIHPVNHLLVAQDLLFSVFILSQANLVLLVSLPQHVLKSLPLLGRLLLEVVIAL